MKKVLFSLFFLAATLPLLARQTVNDPQLLARLDTFLRATERLDMDKVLDHSYPKIFSLASKEAVKEAMLEAFNNEELTIKIDSCHIQKIFPVIEWEKGQYRKINYTFIMWMQFAPSTAGEKEDEEDPFTLTADILKEQYGADNVSVDKEKRKIRIIEHSAMIAAKDDISPEWTFADMENNKAMLNLLFKQALLDKLEEQQ